ncbi:MAG: DNA polymerase III subunit delta, partial [Planctomycetota bacterium]
AVEWLAEEVCEPIPPLIALTGDQRTLKRRILDRLRAARGEDTDVIRFSGSEVDFATVHDELRTSSLWGGSKLVLVEDADRFIAAHRAALERYCDHPARDVVLVLDVSSWNRATRLAKAVEKGGWVIECSPLKGATLQRYVRDVLQKSFGCRIDSDALTLLTELAGPNLGVLEQEAAKLATYVGERRRVTAEDVQKLVGGWKAETTWAMQDAIRDGDVARALDCLDRLLRSGESEYRLLFSMLFTYRRYAQAAELTRDRVRLEDALKRVGLRPFQVKAAAAYLRRLGRETVEQFPSAFQRADIAFKGGSPLRPRAVLERLIVELAGPARMERAVRR